jgi:hypothetical protein
VAEIKGLRLEARAADMCQQLEIRQRMVPWQISCGLGELGVSLLRNSQKVVKSRNLSQPLEIAIEETNSADWT